MGSLKHLLSDVEKEDDRQRFDFVINSSGNPYDFTDLWYVALISPLLF